MEDAAPKTLDLASSLFFTLMIVSLVFVMVRSGERLGHTVTNRIDKVNENVRIGDITKYNNAAVQGSDVLSCIRKNKEDMDITIYKYLTDQETNPTGVIHFDAATELTNLPSEPNTYINPNATYVGKVMKNSNGVPDEVIFTQAFYVDDATYYYASAGSGNGNGDGSGSGGGGSTSGDIVDAIEALNATVSTLGIQFSNLESVTTSILNKVNALGSGNSGGSGGSGGSTVPDDEDDEDVTLSDLANAIEELKGLIEGSDSGSTDTSDLKEQIAAMADSIEAIQDALDLSNENGNMLEQISSANTNMSEQISKLATELTEVSSNLTDLIVLVGTVEADDTGQKQSIVQMLQGLQKTTQELKDALADLTPEPGGGNTETGTETP